MPVGAQGHRHAPPQRAVRRRNVDLPRRDQDLRRARVGQVLPDPDEPLVHLYAEGETTASQRSSSRSFSGWSMRWSSARSRRPHDRTNRLARRGRGCPSRRNTAESRSGLVDADEAEQSSVIVDNDDSSLRVARGDLEGDRGRAVGESVSGAGTANSRASDSGAASSGILAIAARKVCLSVSSSSSTLGFARMPRTCSTVASHGTVLGFRSITSATRSSAATDGGRSLIWLDANATSYGRTKPTKERR